MIQIDTRSDIPLFEQIFNQVRKMIILDIFVEDDQLPTVRTLARQLGVNPNTITKAYSLCEDNELIVSRPGLGYFVLDKNNAKENAMHDFKKTFNLLFEQLKDIGLSDEDIITLVKGELHA